MLLVGKNIALPKFERLLADIFVALRIAVDSFTTVQCNHQQLAIKITEAILLNSDADDLSVLKESESNIIRL